MEPTLVGFAVREGCSLLYYMLVQIRGTCSGDSHAVVMLDGHDEEVPGAGRVSGSRDHGMAAKGGCSFWVCSGCMAFTSPLLLLISRNGQERDFWARVICVPALYKGCLLR